MTPCQEKLKLLEVLTGFYLSHSSKYFSSTDKFPRTIILTLLAASFELSFLRSKKNRQNKNILLQFYLVYHSPIDIKPRLHTI